MYRFCFGVCCGTVLLWWLEWARVAKQREGWLDSCIEVEAWLRYWLWTRTLWCDVIMWFSRRLLTVWCPAGGSVSAAAGLWGSGGRTGSETWRFMCSSKTSLSGSWTENKRRLECRVSDPHCCLFSWLISRGRFTIRVWLQPVDRGPVKPKTYDGPMEDRDVMLIWVKVH